jgi:hypothetical protein
MTEIGEWVPDRCRARLAGSLQSFCSRKRYGCVELAKCGHSSNGPERPLYA